MPANKPAQHDHVRPGADSLGDVTRVADAAIRDHRHICALERRYHIGDGGDLRHPNAGHDPSGADGPRSNTDLDRVRACVHQGFGGGSCGDVAAHDLDGRKGALRPAHTVQHALGVSMRGIHHQHVHAGLGERFGALLCALADTNGCAHTQAPEIVLAGIGVLGGLQDVLHRDQAAQFELVVDHQHPFQPVLVHQRLGVFQSCPLLHRDQPVAWRHDAAHRLVEIGLEAQVAIGHNPDNLSPLYDRESGDLVGADQRRAPRARSWTARW